MRKNLFNLFLVLLSMLTIFLFSSENAASSTKTSKGVAKEVVSIVVKDEKKVEKIVDRDFVVVRKIAHLTEYFLLGFLLINLWASNKKVINYKYVIVAIVIACLYAASDEYHQTLIAGRSGEIKDVIIDTVGASLGSITYYGMFKLFRKRKATIK